MADVILQELVSDLAESGRGFKRADARHREAHRLDAHHFPFEFAVRDKKVRRVTVFDNGRAYGTVLNDDGSCCRFSVRGAVPPRRREGGWSLCRFRPERATRIVEMPARTLGFLRQNGGRSSGRGRDDEFAALQPTEIADIEAIYSELFGPEISDRTDLFEGSANPGGASGRPGVWIKRYVRPSRPNP